MDRHDHAAGPPPMADPSDAPRWSPRSGELDDVELALAGVDLPVTVLVPPSVRDALSAAPGLVLTDPEGTPLALLRGCDDVGAQHDDQRAAGQSPADDESAELSPDRVPTAAETRAGNAATARTAPAPPGELVTVTGSVTALQPAEHGPFRALRRPAGEVRADGSALVVLVDQPLQEAHVTAVATAAAGRSVRLLVLAGEGTPQLVDAATLVRATLSSAAAFDRADVVVVPLTARADPVDDAERRAHVAAAYGSDDTFTLSSVSTAEPIEAVRAALDSGHDPTPGTFAAPVEDLLRRAHRRPDERGLTLLFTGLSGSGKSTLARALAEAVTEQVGRTVTLLDGDVVRRMLSAGLTFSREDRELNVRRIGFVAAEINRHGGLVVCCPIAPYATTRAEVRAMVEAVGYFVLVHVSTPLAECERRDRKGLYAKARAGLLPEFTGISDPYETPTDADLTIDTTDVSVDDGVAQVLDLLRRRGHLAADTPLATRTER